MFEIIPAILPTSLQDLNAKVQVLNNEASLIQIDVADGILVQGTSWPYKEGKEDFVGLLSDKKNLPFLQEQAFEIDLMVSSSVQDVSAWLEIGASRIIIHATSPDAYDALLYLQSNKTGKRPVSVGIALPLTVQPDSLIEFEGLFEYIQIMGIAHLGKQGELFDERALSLLMSVKEKYPDIPLQIDGGINSTSIQKIKDTDVDVHRVVIGSAIFNAEDPLKAFQLFKKNS